MPSNKKLLQAAAGSAGGDNLYVEDVFSTYLYDGTGSDRSVTNDIDLDGEGGMVWIKNRDRSSGTDHVLFDTERGTNKELHSNKTDAEDTSGSSLSAFNSDGFDIDGFNDNLNSSDSGANKYASWTFRKAKKFFDVVTYTGTAATQSIAHNLGSVPGMIIVKSTTAAGGWAVWHNSLSSSTDHWLRLDWTNAEINQANFWPSAPTDSHFTVGGYAANNAENQTLVAYLFASDAGGFGDDESIIKCGSYTGNGNTDGPDINLGFEAQWVMIKRTDGGTNDWIMMDIMRGMPMDSGGAYLRANLSNDEASTAYIQPTATGFKLRNTGSTQVNANGATYIYIAIRRPMKTPESGTEVFAASTRTGTTAPSFPASFDVVDAAFRIYRPGGGDYARKFGSRLTGVRTLYTSSAAAEAPDSEMNWDYMDGWNSDTGVNTDVFSWMFKRATGFFDVVAYTGDGVAGRTVAHNLGVAPELMIVKSRSNADNWAVYDSFNTATHFMNLELSDPSYNNSSRWNGVEPTSEVFTVGTHDTNLSSYTYVGYLFATLAGVSKVGSYTGTGADLNVDCGFSAGARFILVKRTDSSGDWYVWDSARGIVAGNDPYLLLNSTAAEVTNTDYIDPLSSGFTVTSSAPAALNASGGSYIFLAIS